MEDRPFRKQVDRVAESIFRQREEEARRLQRDIADRKALVEGVKESAKVLVPQLFEARDLLLEYDDLKPRAAQTDGPVSLSVSDSTDPITKFFVKRTETTEREVGGLFGKRVKLVPVYKYKLTHWGVRAQGSNVERKTIAPIHHSIEGPGSAVLWLPVEGGSVEVVLDNNDIDHDKGRRLTLDELIEGGVLEWVAKRSSGGLYPSIYDSHEQLRADVFLENCLKHLAEFLGRLTANTKTSSRP